MRSYPELTYNSGEIVLYLDEPFKQLWKGQNPFEKVQQIHGELFRDLKRRKTLRFYLEGQGYFLKMHTGVGYGEIIGDLLRLRRPVIGAQDEYFAVRKLEALGVDTLSVVAFGKTGWNPAHQKSFLITRELENTESLEDFCMSWPELPPSFALKKALIEKVAKITRTLHENGVNHRDYYLCHFLLHVPKDKNVLKPDHLTLWLIDLHRVQIRKKTPVRWMVKDLAALWFSALDIGLTRRDLYRFLCVYTGLPLRDAIQKYQDLRASITKKADRMYARKQRKGDLI